MARSPELFAVNPLELAAATVVPVSSLISSAEI